MEKNSFKWMKKIIGILIPLALFSCLSMQIFADFGGDGNQVGDLMYPAINVSTFEINHLNGGTTNDIDNISFAPLPIYYGGSLISEVSRGVYGNGTNQFYRYTTTLLRSLSSVTQNYTFDAPLFSSSTAISLTCLVPYVTDVTQTFLLDVQTGDQSAYIDSIYVSYDRVSLDSTSSVDLTDNRLNWSTTTLVEHVSRVGLSPSGMFPYEFRLIDWIDPNIIQFITNLEIRFTISIANPGIFELSYTSDYSIYPPEDVRLADFGSESLILENVIVEPVFMDEIPFAQAVINTFQDIGEIQLFGAFTIGDIMWAFIGIGLLVVFLRFFAGG